HHHGRQVVETRKVAHHPLVHVRDPVYPAAAAGTYESLIAALPPHPQFQAFGRFDDLAPPDSIPRPSQNLRPVTVSQTAQCTENGPTRESPSIRESFSFSRRAIFRIDGIVEIRDFLKRD